MKLSILIFVVSLMFLSCAPKYETIVMQEYRGFKIENASLVIAPLMNMMVDYVGNVKDEFGEGNQEELIVRHFKDRLLQGLKDQSRFSSVSFDAFAGQPVLRNRSFKTSDPYGLSVNVPADTVAIAFKSSTPDFILFIQDLRIGQEGVQDNTWGQAETGNSLVLCMDDERDIAPAISDFRETGSPHLGFQPPVYTPPPTFTQPMNYYSPPKTTYLRYKCSFAFWDNRAHKVAAYGKIFAKSKADSYGLGMVTIVRMGNWIDIDNRFIRALIGQTPFDKY